MKIKMLTACVLMMYAFSAIAGIGFSRNRMVYPQGSQSISLKVINTGDSPYLIQSKVTADTETTQPAPFIVTPPLLRLDGQGEAMIRIMAVSASLPLDRESVFYYSGRAIPSTKKTDEDEGKLSASVTLSIRSVMKVFFRPTGLKMTQSASLEKMTFTQTVKGVLVKNPTPYYQSFAQLMFDGKAVDLDSQPEMVAPFGELLFPTGANVQQVSWRVMDDYGGSTDLKTQHTVE